MHQRNMYLSFTPITLPFPQLQSQITETSVSACRSKTHLVCRSPQCGSRIFCCCFQFYLLILHIQIRYLMNQPQTRVDRLPANQRNSALLGLDLGINFHLVNTIQYASVASALMQDIAEGVICSKHKLTICVSFSADTCHLPQGVISQLILAFHGTNSQKITPQ